MKLKLPSVKIVNLFAFFVCCGLLSFAAYLQISVGLDPCPLCMIQRLIVLMLSVLFLIGGTLFLQYTAKTWYHFFIFFVASLGVAVAGRQVWLQHLPPGKIPPCGPSLNYLLQNFPLKNAFFILAKGSGECAQVTWRFLNLSIAEWTLIFFAFFAVLSLWQIFRK